MEIPSLKSRKQWRKWGYKPHTSQEAWRAQFSDNVTKYRRALAKNEFYITCMQEHGM